jgi:hypothetical protein
MGRALCPDFLKFQLNSVRLFGRMTSMSFGVGREGFDGFHDPLATLRGAVDGLLAQDPAELTDGELGADLVRLRRQIDRLEAGFAERCLAANRRGVGLEDGHVSSPAWVAWKAGMTRGAVAKSIRHAELCELLPETGAGWRDGTVRTTAVELIAAARVDGCDEELAAMEPEFLDRARRGDHKSLRILTQHFKACARADGSKPVPPDGFTVAEVGDRGVVNGDFAKPALQTIREALEKFTRPPTADDGTSLAQRQAEGFVRMCEVALGRGIDAEGALPAVSYLTHERTADDATEPLTLGMFSGVIDPRDRDRILCDATITRIETDPNGTPLSVGRATRVWPTAIRKAIIARDRHCQWPGCEIPAHWCDVHHAISWEDGGDTSSENGHLLCRRHHTFRHRHRDWTYTFDHQRFRAYRPDGTELHPDAWHDIAA